MKNFFIGIDVSKMTLDVALHSKKGNEKQNHLVIENNPNGFKKMISWIKEKKMTPQEVLICMEHTGVYANALVQFLEKKDITYCRVSALEIKKSLGITRGKADKVDAFRIAQYAYEKRESLTPSKLPPQNIIVLKELLTERKGYVCSITQYKQRKDEIAVHQGKKSMKRKNQTIDFLEKKVKEIEDDILKIIQEDPELMKNFAFVISVIGIGFINAVSFLAYTNNFRDFTNPRAYACYISVAPFPYSSGTSIRKRTSVSKIGRLELKGILTMAARSAIIHDPELRRYFKRKFNGKKGPESNYGQVLNAVKFKLICRVFAVVRKQEKYVVKD